MKSRSSLRLTLACALSLAGGLAACGQPAAKQPEASASVRSAPPEPPRKTRLVAEDLAAHQGGCKVDDDCELVRADCCGCPRGGADTAVVRGHKNQVDGLLTCSGVFCAGKENLACKSGRAVCRDGTCSVEGGTSAAR